MTYKEKKSFYESIMKEVSKTVKKHINENLLAPAKFFTVNFSELYKIINNLHDENNSRPLLIITPNQDATLAVKCMIKTVFNDAYEVNCSDIKDDEDYYYFKLKKDSKKIVQKGLLLFDGIEQLKGIGKHMVCDAAGLSFQEVSIKPAKVIAISSSPDSYFGDEEDRMSPSIHRFLIVKLKY